VCAFWRFFVSLMSLGPNDLNSNEDNSWLIAYLVQQYSSINQHNPARDIYVYMYIYMYIITGKREGNIRALKASCLIKVAAG